MLAHDEVNRWFLDPVTGRGYPEAPSAPGAGGARRCSTATWS